MFISDDPSYPLKYVEGIRDLERTLVESRFGDNYSEVLDNPNTRNISRFGFDSPKPEPVKVSFDGMSTRQMLEAMKQLRRGREALARMPSSVSSAIGAESEAVVTSRLAGAAEALESLAVLETEEVVGVSVASATEGGAVMAGVAAPVLIGAAAVLVMIGVGYAIYKTLEPSPEVAKFVEPDVIGPGPGFQVSISREGDATHIHKDLIHSFRAFC
jgi:hypothetical protein